MFKRSSFLALMLVVVLSFSFTIPAYAAVNGRIYGDEDIIDDSEGQVWEIIDGEWRCTDIDGDPVRGWAKRDDHMYFLNKDGFIKTGWIKDNGKWYYLYSDSDNVTKELIGTLATDTWIDNYYVDKTGAQTKIKK